MEGFVRLKISATTPRRKALRYSEASLCSGVENYVMAYHKVWSGLRSVEPYATAYWKARYKKIYFLHSHVENYAAAYQKIWSRFISL